jgi:sulfite reductase (NADPH) hemoprotein beta-component
MLARIAREYDKGFGHFTTRQNLQYNWPKPGTGAGHPARCWLSVQMHAIQTSGNCIRNVTADHFAGVAPDEIEDPRPGARSSASGPRSIPNSRTCRASSRSPSPARRQDRAAIKVHDIGLHLVRKAAGERSALRSWVGGGLGRMPIIGQRHPRVPRGRGPARYLEAILRVYNQHGRRDNIHKARIKVLVKAVGPAKFREMVDAELAEASRDTAPVYSPPPRVARVQAFFTPPDYQSAAR